MLTLGMSAKWVKRTCLNLSPMSAHDPKWTLGMRGPSRRVLGAALFRLIPGRHRQIDALLFQLLPDPFELLVFRDLDGTSV